MKCSYFPVAAFLLLFVSILQAQTVQSLCGGPASLQAKYEQDAWYVAHNYLLEKDSVKWSSVAPIPNNVKDSVLAAILGVYNADLAARDTVIDLFDIHNFPKNDLTRFEMLMDTSHPWVRAFLSGSIGNTSNFYVDSMTAAYGFEIENVVWFPAWVTDYDVHVRVKCNSYFNTDFLAQAMASINGVVFANPYVFGGDGNRIFYRPMGDFTEVTFRRGWADCPGGCLYQRDWLFRIFPDCKVQFVSSYGDDLSLSSNNMVDLAKMGFSVFPNPSAGQINILAKRLFDGEVQINLYSFDGRLVFSKNSKVEFGQIQQDLDLSSVPRGTYVLTILDKNQIVARELVVKE